jgi:DNA primase
VKFSIGKVLEYYGAAVPYGGGYAKLRCPFHDDRHPSATVNHVKQTFKCYVCDVSGDAIDVIRWREGSSNHWRKRPRGTRPILLWTTWGVGESTG